MLVISSMGPYSIDLRQRIVDAYRNDEGSVRDLAERFVVAPNTVQNYLTRMRATGSVAPSPPGGGSYPKIDEAGLQQLRSLVDEKNDQTLPELAKRWAPPQGVEVSRWTLSRALRRLGLTRKKRRFEPASKTDPMCKTLAPGFGDGHRPSGRIG
jgi:putative transposase